MSSTEVHLSERLPMLSSTEEVVHSNPVTPGGVTSVETTTVVKKNVDVNVNPEDNNKFIQVIRPLLVELIGTALFVLIGLWGACSNGGVIAAALSFGLALAVLSASFGHISGVHFNPSVTIGVLIAGEMQAVMAILYVVVQLLGGIAAAGVLRLLLATRPYDACKGGATVLTTYVAQNATVANGGVSYAADYVRNWQGILTEAVVTFVLVTVILMVALDTKSKTGLAPLLIGFALAVNILAIGAYTGGSLNPARSLGPAIFANQWEHHYVYWIGPLVGAIVAGFLYRAVWAHHDRRLFVKNTKTTTTTTTGKQ
jgi:MIP family channel proteins